MCFSEPKIKIYFKQFLKSDFNINLLQVLDKNGRGRLEEEHYLQDCLWLNK